MKHLKHCETLKTLWNIMKQSSFYPTISALDAVDVGARCGDVCIWGSDVDDLTEVIRCDDIGDRCRDVVARCEDVIAWRGDVGDRTKLPAISAIAELV